MEPSLFISIVLAGGFVRRSIRGGGVGTVCGRCESAKVVTADHFHQIGLS